MPKGKITTQRISLRKLDESDLDHLYALDSDPEVMRYISDGLPRTKEQVKAGLQKAIDYYDKHPGFGVWAAMLKNEDRFIGWACLKQLDQSEHIEVGYRLLKNAWAKGYATELAKALVEYGFMSMKLNEIVGITHPDNAASQNVLEKAGLHYVKKDRFYDADVLFYSIKRK